MLTISLCILSCPAFSMNTTKVECLKSQVERVSYQREMAELVRALITWKIPTRKLWHVRSSPDSARHLSPKKMLVTTVEFPLHPPSPPATAPPFPPYTTQWKHVQWCVDSSPDFRGAVFTKCFLHLIVKNRCPLSRLCRLRAKKDVIVSLSSGKGRLIECIK